MRRDTGLTCPQAAPVFPGAEWLSFLAWPGGMGGLSAKLGDDINSAIAAAGSKAFGYISRPPFGQPQALLQFWRVCISRSADRKAYSHHPSDALSPPDHKKTGLLLTGRQDGKRRTPSERGSRAGSPSKSQLQRRPPVPLAIPNKSPRREGAGTARALALRA